MTTINLAMDIPVNIVPQRYDIQDYHIRPYAMFPFSSKSCSSEVNADEVAVKYRVQM